jgi:hypothetical protein
LMASGVTASSGLAAGFVVTSPVDVAASVVTESVVGVVAPAAVDRTETHTTYAYGCVAKAPVNIHVCPGTCLQPHTISCLSTGSALQECKHATWCLYIGS